MPYLLTKKTGTSRPLSGLGCSCSSARRSPLGIAPGEPIPISTAASGATDVVKNLQRQLNRFSGSSVPADVRFLKAPLPVTGTIDMGTAIHAVIVIQKRAADALATYQDNASKAVFTGANAAFANPVPFVNDHLGDVVTIVSNYADAKGLPAAGGLLSNLPVSKTVILAGLALGALLFLRR